MTITAKQMRRTSTGKMKMSKSLAVSPENKDRPNTLRVFVHAPWEFRVEKSREKISGSDEEIEKFLRKDDKRKQDYYRKFAGGDWSDATNYDLCLNAGKLGFEKCVDAILAQMNVMGIK